MRGTPRRGDPTLRPVTITLRIAPDIHERVQTIARENGVSQSAVWKILITQHIRPVLVNPRIPVTPPKVDPDLPEKRGLRG